jgi:predicted anti-sigma-YlaC factor YlaD
MSENWVEDITGGYWLKIELAVIGIILFALIGFLIGALLEHPIGPGGLQFMGALIGATVALAILMLGEALKSR